MGNEESVDRPENVEQLGIWLESVKPKLLSYIDKNLGPALRSRLEPDDILQEVVVSAFSNPSQVIESVREPFRMVCQMAEQRIIDAHRRHVGAEKRSVKREVSLNQPAASANDGNEFMNMLVASMTSPSGAFSREQREFRLAAALSELTEEQQTALRMRYVEGLSTKEVAEAIGKSDGAVRVMLSRTVTELQNYMKEAG
ncbi:MAG: sigma-70 family RNA polymerase sigma factor [Planctomycetaceae bacterium]